MNSQRLMHILYHSIRSIAIYALIFLFVLGWIRGHAFVYEVEPTLPEVQDQIHELEQDCQEGKVI